MMSIFDKHNRAMTVTPDGDTYYEQWVSGTYIVAGVFHRKCHTIEATQIQENIPKLFEFLKANKKGRWPKGICAYYAIPIYTCDHLDANAVEWVNARPKYRSAMWHEPVLYDRNHNIAEMNARWGLFCSAYRAFLFEVFTLALQGLSKREGHALFPQINGEVIVFEEQGQQ
jgi:hypothetical protein